MNDSLESFLFLVLAYGFGSLPFGLLVARALAQEDPRKKGSGNIGATNVSRVAGLKAGILTLLLDAGKALLATSVPLLVTGGRGLALVCALMVVLGQMFPVWLRFKGGKGIACILGASVVLAPEVVLVGVLSFALTVWVTRLVSLSSLLALLSGLCASWFLTPQDTGLKALLLAFFLLGTLKHKENIRRLLRGEEPKFRIASRV
jgi:glycerol-3-phosphate acyltransferase PlsY